MLDSAIAMTVTPLCQGCLMSSQRPPGERRFAPDGDADRHPGVLLSNHTLRPANDYSPLHGNSLGTACVKFGQGVKFSQNLVRQAPMTHTLELPFSKGWDRAVTSGKAGFAALASLCNETAIFRGRVKSGILHSPFALFYRRLNPLKEVLTQNRVARIWAR